MNIYIKIKVKLWLNIKKGYKKFINDRGLENFRSLKKNLFLVNIKQNKLKEGLILQTDLNKSLTEGDHHIHLDWSSKFIDSPLNDQELSIYYKNGSFSSSTEVNDGTLLGTVYRSSSIGDNNSNSFSSYLNVPSGSTYNIGSGYEIENIQLVKKICNYIQYKHPNKKKYVNLIRFVKDRQGHDYRYKINSNKIMNKIGSYNFKSFDYNLFKTIDWYLENKKWLLKK